VLALTSTIKGILTSAGKFLADVPGEPRDLLRGLSNARQVLWFVAARKLGLTVTARVALAHAGRLHVWPLVERSDVSALQEVFLDREYLLDVSPLPATVFDLGANFGSASVYFAQRWPSARIIAVEPNPQVFSRLQSMVAGYPNIECICCAVGGVDGCSTFTVASDHLASSLVRQDPRGQQIEVEVQTIRTLMSRTGVSHIDVLKFDVEGAEEELFRDPSIFSSVGAMIGEVHLDLLKMSEAEFLAQFESLDVEKRSQHGDLFLMTAMRP
jgi:FkbM family methyltransferase